MAAPKNDPSVVTLRVESLESDVHEIKDSIGALDQKFDTAISNLGHEMRAALGDIADKFNDRQKTPWPILIPAAALIVTVMGYVGHQSLDPIITAVKALQKEVVPRLEIDARAQARDNKIGGLEHRIEGLEITRIDEMRSRINRLEDENRALKTK